MQAIKLKIESLAHDGRGIGFLPGRGRGRAVFVEGALPGESALCKITRDKGALLEAELVEILDYAPNSSAARCQHAPSCGGCPLLQMPYNKQLFWKEKLLKDALIRIGGLDAGEVEALCQPVKASPEIFEYRNKLSLAFGLDHSGMARLGMRKRASHEVFSLKKCLIVDDGVLPIIQFMEKAMLESGLPPYANGAGFWRQLVLRRGGIDKGAWSVRLLTSPASTARQGQMKQIAEKMLHTIPGCGAFVYDTISEKAGRKTEMRLFSLNNEGLDEPQAARLEHGYDGKIFSFDIASFMQVNSGAACELADIAWFMDKKCENKRGLLDLYCGSGFPGQLLAPGYKACLGIELDAAAVESARLNAGGHSEWTYLRGDAARLLRTQKKKGKWSTALIDPPRSGLDNNITSWLCAAGLQNIIYVSCNPATLARDLKRLAPAWTLLELATVDMFPHTPHVEAVALLRGKACGA